MLRRFGKSAAGILGVRQSFFDENAKYLSLATAQAELYIAQPRRERCKLCEELLPHRPDFVKLTIPYASCRRCGQLNGLHQDTDAFCSAIYLDESYATYYGSADEQAYRYRVNAVYRPKIDFLAEALGADGHDFTSFRYADIGSGSGYLVAALIDAGIDDCVGLDVSPHQTEYANRMVPGHRCHVIEIAQVAPEIRSLDADVVSMIGVLEHLQNPRDVLQALRDNPRVKYLFLCVPLFGLCVFFEMVFPNAYPRHLVADHTHLFTESSLQWMERAYGLDRRAEWWFGSDMLDLYRDILVSLSQKAEMRDMAADWMERMRPLIDPMQLAIDERRLASEAHLVFRIDR